MNTIPVVKKILCCFDIYVMDRNSLSRRIIFTQLIIVKNRTSFSVYYVIERRDLFRLNCVCSFFHCVVLICTIMFSEAKIPSFTIDDEKL